MTKRTGSRSDEARLFYDLTADVANDFSFMNYGYAPVASRHGVPGPERYCLELYDRLLDGVELENRRVLEVSCGRGGGAAHIVATREPAAYVGIDISEGNIAIASERFADVKRLSFRVGNAECLPFPDRTFDAVINVEASHLYDDPARFFAEVHRVLRPDGDFLYTDLFWSNSEPERLMREAGIDIVASEDITPNVLQALELDSERRERIMATRIPDSMRQNYRDWSGVKGYRAYNRLASREWVYRRFRARRPD